MTRLAFDNPMAWAWGLPVLLAVLGLFVWVQRRSGLPVRRLAVLTALRAGLFFGLLALLARPVWTQPDDAAAARDRVVVLFDASESMSLREGSSSRFRQAVDFARDRLSPILDESAVNVTPILFDEDIRLTSGRALPEIEPDGPETNLARAIASSILADSMPPLAVIALTDGIATVDRDNSRAVSALVTHRVPFVGFGFGSATGGRILSLEDMHAPAVVAPDQHFRVSARLRTTGDAMPAFDLLLLRNGQLIDRRTIAGFEGPRLWQESFEVSESAEGLNTYTVQLMPPQAPSIRSPSLEASGTVRVVQEGDLRVLYLQGGLTWDYKFIQLALRNDPAIKLSGLSRTASTSNFFENVQNDIELTEGFPSTIEKLNEFRVVVLSNLRPGDLTPRQQQLLAQFCGEYGGGVLMIGGTETFQSSWQDSRLEDLLPVHFATLAGAASTTRFRVQLTPAAETHPIFQISDDGSTRAAWANLPVLHDAARVSDVKRGAEVWLKHDGLVAGHEPVVMAAQRFGNGMSAVICTQSFWRWRLARSSNTEHYDRFWRQLVRHLSEAGRETISLTLRDQQLTPERPIRLTIERRADTGTNAAPIDMSVKLVNEHQQEIARQNIALVPDQSRDLTFEPDAAGLFTAIVEDTDGIVLASHAIHIREIAAEFLSTGIRMETLNQWAALSGGFATRAADCPDLADQLTALLHPHNADSPELPYVMPAGVNGWSLLALLSLICTEWVLRKRWSLT